MNDKPFDRHAATAAKFFGVSNVTPSQRKVGKCINFSSDYFTASSMDLYPEKQAQSGRTTRMIRYALNNPQRQLLIGVARHDHVKPFAELINRIAEHDQKSRDHISVVRCPFYSDRDPSIQFEKIVSDSINGYDESRSGGASHLIIDHSVFEAQLSDVIRYLRTTPTSVEEMVKVANMMEALGKAPYLILDDDAQDLHYARLHKFGGVQVETFESLPHFNWLTLTPNSNWKVHPNCIFIPDPIIIKRMWKHAFKEMVRWNRDKNEQI